MFALFRSKPEYAIYCDYGKDGLYRPRIVRRTDPGIDRGKPIGIFQLPVRSAFDTYAAAVQRMAEKMAAMGLHYSSAHVFAEQAKSDAEGNPKAGPPVFRGTIAEVLDQ